jgi:division protein CdvB (Snf7/Vps24/ESCRT-III family)
LPEKFTRKWREVEERTPLYTKMKEAIRPKSPLKPRLNFAIRRIKAQIQRLDNAANNFSERDKSLFARIIEAYSKRDMMRANIYANELAEIRKMEKMVTHSKLAMEQIVIRLRTVTELGDVIGTLAPTVDVLRNVKAEVAKIFPEAETEFEQIGNLLNGIIMDAGQGTQFNINLEAANEDAQKILNEAASVAEKKIEEEQPKIPSTLTPIPVRKEIQTQT